MIFLSSESGQGKTLLGGAGADGRRDARHRQGYFFFI